MAVPGSHEEGVLSARWLSLPDWPALVRAMAAQQATLAGGVSGPALPAEAASELDVGELVVVPVGVAGELTGFVVADTRSRTLALSDEELELLTAVGAVGGVLLEAACQQEHTRRISELKSHFVTLASHELRAPFAVMHGIITTLQHRAGALPEEQLARLRNGLYDRASVRSGSWSSSWTSPDWTRKRSRSSARGSRSARVSKKLVETVAGERTAGFEIDVPPDLVVDADPMAFDRIVSNLVANAVRYGRAPITIAARQRDRHFRLTVEDRGEGVARDFVPRLFDRFSRGNEATGDGSGLGLSIAKSYAQAHGGELVYESAHPNGARFELVLPSPHADEPNERFSAS